MNHTPSLRHAPHGTVALLIDGDNIASSHSSEILRHANPEGQRRVFRIYGNATHCPNWAAYPGANFVHCGGRKNATDIRQSIDAAHLLHTHDIKTFVIASSDGDLSHIALYLVEQGCRVMGLGDKKAPKSFRAACTEFYEIGAPVSDKQIIEALKDIIRNAENPNGASLSTLNSEMRKRLGIRISERPEKTWRGFLNQHDDIFHLDPKGPNARVRIRRGVAQSASG